MRKLENFNLLLMLIALAAVGQMTQTIYVPVIAEIAVYFGEPSGSVQRVMAAYLFSYGFSQLVYGPLSDQIGRRPVILAGLTIFLISTIVAIFAPSLTVLTIASGLQGLGTGVAGVMVRTMPRDLYKGTSLRFANSLLNMGVLVSPLLAPMFGGILAHFFGWHACYIFLFLLGGSVFFSMYRWLPETRPVSPEKHKMLASFRELLSNGPFVSYLIMLIGALAGIAVFESSSGVLMGGVLGLSSITVSILFILPIPAAFFGAWYAGREGKNFASLMWQSVMICLAAGLMMWIPSWFGMMNIWTLLVPAAIFFFGAGMLFPLATTGAMEPFPYLAGAAGALVGGMQNVGSGVATWVSALMPQNGQFSLGLLMFLMSALVVLCWLPLARRMSHTERTV
ncbi:MULTISPECIES: multidrug efflux MFS transporter EmrD [Providencia]|nr:MULTISPECIES: multidrug efflux MFS transporter EmrD [Providencia]EFB70588.1 transporter, major facilitator family protein [Providencia rustigianii DSM 4541]MTC55648.1 multidrug efflux MFS transporter EmrD [Providencia rustigianii]MTC60680.1 multidrug efflux MFS transporter EmrD [Providencia rustigianii]VEH57106.1 Multidrug resistance protein D [Providencia rustigianii]